MKPAKHAEKSVTQSKKLIKDCNTKQDQSPAMIKISINCINAASQAHAHTTYS
jgi:hypothetical protein